jgi:DNA polymerase/3'-5' exonuclease PolX
MSEKRRIPLREAEALADELLTLLRPACIRLEVAGSIRRRKPDCGDVELVAIPKLAYSDDLFGLRDDVHPFNELDALCAELRESGVLGERLDKNGRRAWGSAMKRATFKGFALDLFACTAEQWGVTFAIRTGGALFSHALVTPRNQTVRDESGRAFGSGLCPPWLHFRDWRVKRADEAGNPFPTPEEEDVFDLLGVEVVPPQERDAFMESRAAAGAAR